MTRRIDRRRLALGLVVMFLGGAGLVYEYCLSTLATHLIGNSIEQFSVIIALMLFAMGVAGAVQRHIGLGEDAGGSVATAFVAVEVALALIGGASAIGLYLAFAYLEHFRLILYGLAMVIGFGIGMEIPLLLRLNESERPDLKDNVGEILALDYVGALAGALLWAFVLLPRMALDRISLLLGLANLIAAAATLWLLRERIERRRTLALAIVAGGALLSLLWFQGPRVIEDARQHLYADPVRHHATSRFQDIVVTGAGRRMSLFLNGKLQFDSEDEHIYHELLVHPGLTALTHRGRQPVRVLVLGGGDGLAVREVLRWPSVAEVLLVDLDPAVTELARAYQPWVDLNGGALLDARVRIRAGEVAGASAGPAAEPVPIIQPAQRRRLALRRHAEQVAEVSLLHVDADVFLRQADAGRWDAVIIDFPDPSTPDLAKLFSLEFFQQLRRRLAPGGVVAMQAGSPYANRRAFWAIRDTLEAAGFVATSLHAHVPTFGEWGWHLAHVPAATDDPSAAPSTLNPVGPLPTGARYATAAIVEAALTFPSSMARPAGPPQVSTRLHPLVMTLYRAGEPLDGPTLFPGHSYR